MFGSFWRSAFVVSSSLLLAMVFNAVSAVVVFVVTVVVGSIKRVRMTYCSLFSCFRFFMVAVRILVLGSVHSGKRVSMVV